MRPSHSSQRRRITFLSLASGLARPLSNGMNGNVFPGVCKAGQPALRHCTNGTSSRFPVCILSARFYAHTPSVQDASLSWHGTRGPPASAPFRQQCILGDYAEFVYTDLTCFSIADPCNGFFGSPIYRLLLWGHLVFDCVSQSKSKFINNSYNL